MATVKTTKKTAKKPSVMAKMKAAAAKPVSLGEAVGGVVVLVLADLALS